jgi:hypothetical protein
MALFYAFRDQAGTWHGEPNLPIDQPSPDEAPMTIVDTRSPFYEQTVTARAASTEGSRRGGIGSYVVLDNGYRLCATEYVEHLLFPWTAAEDFYGEHAGAVEPLPASIVQWNDN